MGSLFSEEAVNREPMSPEASNPGALNMVEEIHFSEDTKGNMEESTMPLEEPTPDTGEKKEETSGRSQNQAKDKVR